MIQDKMLPVLEDLLSWTSKRQQAMAANVANLDTPGYRAKDYSFAKEMASSLNMTATSGSHIAPAQDTSPARLYEVETNVKPNGNNVDLDRELTEITKNGLQYVTLVQFLNHKLRTMRSAISEGGKV
jgi:flagellar basal-body rod protein FlgB